jgi:hypothetical protein
MALQLVASVRRRRLAVYKNTHTLDTHILSGLDRVRNRRLADQTAHRLDLELPKPLEISRGLGKFQIQLVDRFVCKPPVADTIQAARGSSEVLFSLGAPARPQSLSRPSLALFITRFPEPTIRKTLRCPCERQAAPKAHVYVTSFVRQAKQGHPRVLSRCRGAWLIFRLEFWAPQTPIEDALGAPSRSAMP